MPNVKIKHQMFWGLLNTFIQISDMFHPNTDVKANLKLLTITDEKYFTGSYADFWKGVGVRINMFYLIILHCFPYYLKH